MSVTTAERIHDFVSVPKNRDEMALCYSDLLEGMIAVDWPLLNGAIIERWSRSGLDYIKREAWKHLNGLNGTVPR